MIRVFAVSASHISPPSGSVLTAGGKQAHTKQIQCDDISGNKEIVTEHSSTANRPIYLFRQIQYLTITFYNIPLIPVSIQKGKKLSI
jgi:hypothetical protein